LLLILYSSRSACIEPEVKRPRSRRYENRHGRTVAMTRAAAAMCCCCRRVRDGRAHGSASTLSTYPPAL